MTTPNDFPPAAMPLPTVEPEPEPEPAFTPPDTTPLDQVVQRYVESKSRDAAARKPVALAATVPAWSDQEMGEARRRSDALTRHLDALGLKLAMELDGIDPFDDPARQERRRSEMRARYATPLYETAYALAVSGEDATAQAPWWSASEMQTTFAAAAEPALQQAITNATPADLVAYAKLALRSRGDDQRQAVTLTALLRREMARRGQSLPVEVRDQLADATSMALPLGRTSAEAEKRAGRLEGLALMRRRGAVARVKVRELLGERGTDFTAAKLTAIRAVRQPLVAED
jgi:hypothetical protein